MRNTPQIVPLSEEHSQRITALRFLLMVAIVVIHARGHQEEIRGLSFGPESLGGGAWFLQEMLSAVLARTAVPLFFIFSGFLTAASLSRKGYCSLLTSRFRTLVVPFLFWNTLTFALYCIVSPDRLAAANPLQIYGVTELPAAYQFWFMRDLIVLVLISPLWLTAARTVPRLAVTGALVLWFCPPTELLTEGAPIDPAAICFFQIGVTLRLWRLRIPLTALRLIAFAYLPLAVADALVSNEPPSGFVFHKVVLLFGMVAVWQFGAWLVKVPRLPAMLTGSAFMIYAAHEPLLGALKKISYYLIKPDGDMPVTAIYLTSIIVSICACVVANYLAARWLPKAHALITGGR